jgi:plastocyanin
VRRTVPVLILAAAAFMLLVPTAEAASHDVHLAGGLPQPQQVNVASGDTVFFVNDDNVAHAIFANGQQFGDTIMPHQTGGPYGPFTGDGAEYAYRVDSNTGPCGVVVVGGGSSSACAGPPPTTTKPTTTAPPATTTTAAPATTTTAAPATTSTSTTTTTTTQPSTTTSSSSSSEVAAGSDSSSDDNGSTNGVRIAGIALMMIGVIGLIVALASQRRHAAAAAPPPEEEPVASG